MQELFIPPSANFIDFIVQDLQTSHEVLDLIMIEFNIRDNHTLLMNTFNPTDNSVRTKSGITMTVDIRDNGYINNDSNCTLNRESDGNYTTECIVVRNDAELEQIKQRVIKLRRLQDLSQDVLIHMIQVGSIKGKDLVSLCITNSRLNEFCESNNYIFMDLIKQDYPKLAKYVKDNSPTEMYIKFEKGLGSIYDAMVDEFTNTHNEGVSSYSGEKFDKHIANFDQALYDAAEDMYDNYEAVGKLDDLRSAELDWYREFLYEHINYDDVMGI